MTQRDESAAHPPSSPTSRTEVLRGLKDAAPLTLAVVPYGVVLGAQAARVGLTSLETAAMTGLNFAGGSEFAAIRLWAAAPPLMMIILVTLLINSRHIVMGAALAPFMKNLPKRKVIPALFFMADEGWAVSYADTLKRAREGHAQPFSWPYYLGACVPFYPIWVIAAVLGTVVGPALGDIDSYGFAMSFPAVFLVLLRGMWTTARAARPWLISLVVASTCYLLVPGAWYVLAGTFAGMLSAFIWAEPK